MGEGQESLPPDKSEAELASAAVNDVDVDGADSGRPSAPTQDPLDLLQRLDEISVGLARLHDVLDERLRYDESKEGAFRQLYEDLERFRALATAAQYKPVLVDLILLLDRVEKGLADQAEDSFILSIRDELSEILARRGVSAISTSEDRFDPQRQRAVGTRATPDEAAHNSVAEIVRTGYECDGQILRATEVIVYRHLPA